MKTLTSELQANLILLLKDAWGHVDLCSAAQKAVEVVEMCGSAWGTQGFLRTAAGALKSETS